MRSVRCKEMTHHRQRVQRLSLHAPSHSSAHSYSCEAAGLVEVSPRPGESLLRTEDILAAIAAEGDALALVLFSGVQVSCLRR